MPTRPSRDDTPFSQLSATSQARREGQDDRTTPASTASEESNSPTATATQTQTQTQTQASRTRSRRWTTDNNVRLVELLAQSTVFQDGLLKGSPRGRAAHSKRAALSLANDLARRLGPENPRGGESVRQHIFRLQDLCKKLRKAIEHTRGGKPPRGLGVSAVSQVTLELVQEKFPWYNSMNAMMLDRSFEEAPVRSASGARLQAEQDAGARGTDADNEELVESDPENFIDTGASIPSLPAHREADDPERELTRPVQHDSDHNSADGDSPLESAGAPRKRTRDRLVEGAAETYHRSSVERKRMALESREKRHRERQEAKMQRREREMELREQQLVEMRRQNEAGLAMQREQAALTRELLREIAVMRMANSQTATGLPAWDAPSHPQLTSPFSLTSRPSSLASSLSRRSPIDLSEPSPSTTMPPP